MKKVMLIDPRGRNDNSYFTGLVGELSKQTNLTVVAKEALLNEDKGISKLMPLFNDFNNKKWNKFSKIFKGLNYINSYIKIIRELKKEKYDVVHIQWLLMYKFDLIALKVMKRYCRKVVFTAHNVLPHVNGHKFINDLRNIYDSVDNIILHGENIRKEFVELFPEHSKKVNIQYHGTYINQQKDFDINKIDIDLQKRLSKYDKVFIFTGIMFYNKGVDRLVKIWLNNFVDTNNLLIVAGKKQSDYKELSNLEDKVNECKNILYINEYVEPDLFSYLVKKSHIIILPYRHASMSGVIFTAAEFCKPVLCTDVGSLSEYLINSEDSFIINDSDQELFCKIKNIVDNKSIEELKVMGNKLNKNITDKFSWGSIVSKLIAEVY